MFKVDIANFLDLLGLSFIVLFCFLIFDRRNKFQSRLEKYLIFMYFLSFLFETIEPFAPKYSIYKYQFSVVDTFLFLYLIKLFHCSPWHVAVVISYFFGINYFYQASYDWEFTVIDYLFNLGYLTYFSLRFRAFIRRESLRFYSKNKYFIQFIQMYLLISFIYYGIIILGDIVTYSYGKRFSIFYLIESLFQIAVFILCLRYFVFHRPVFAFVPVAVPEKNREIKGQKEEAYASSSLEEREDFETLKRSVVVQAMHRSPKLTIQELASLLDKHPKQVSRLINTYTDGNFNDFINKLRVDDFKVLVLEPAYQNYSILGIAKEVGFSSKSTFYKAFKKFEGMSPSEYVEGTSQN